MLKNLPNILVKANLEVQNLIRNLQVTDLKSNFIFTTTTGEAENLLHEASFDLIIFQIEDAGKKKLRIDMLHSILSGKNQIPIIYIHHNANQKLFDLKKMVPGSFDLVAEPIEKYLLINKISLFLKTFTLRKELTGFGSDLSENSTTKTKRITLSKKLNERTKQLSNEIQNNIKTKLELYNQNKRLDENQQIFKSLLDAIPNPTVIKDHLGKYLQWNHAFEDFLGMNGSELSGKTAFDLYDKDFAAKIHQFDKDQLKSTKASVQEYTYTRPEGTVLHLMLHKNMFLLGSSTKPGTITTIVDVTHLKRVEDLLNVQYTIDYITSLEKGVKSTLDQILDHLFHLYWVDGGGIYLFDKYEKILRLISYKGLSKKYVQHVKYYDENSHQVKLLKDQTKLYIRNHDLSHLTKKLATKEGFKFVAILPLIDQKSGEVVGSLNLASKDFEKISEQDKKGIESIAARIVNLILYAQGQEKLKEYKLLLEQKVEEKTSELKLKIDELVTKENEIRISEKKYRKLQENLPVGIFTTNMEGKFLHVNPSCIKIFGYKTTDEMMKVAVIDMYYSKEQRNEFIQILLSDGKLINQEVQLVRKDKTVFWGLLRVQAAFDKNGKPYLFDGIIEDISEIKSARLKLEAANKKIASINKNLENKIQEALSKQEEQNSLLIQKSKLESLGELSAGIAHEINQPLGVMALIFENLKLKINNNQLTPHYIETKFRSLEDNIKRIREIIDHIRTFSRDQESFVLDKVNVNNVVRKALLMIGVQYRNHNINIRLDLKEDIGFTVGSNLKLEQVILNLLANSKYALEEKGIFENETEFTKEILIKTDTTTDKIILLIEDNGMGIKAKYLTKIFDPFFTTKPEGFGTGLGLSIVYGLVKDMHGEILVNSREKEYTKFKIIFPRFPEND